MKKKNYINTKVYNYYHMHYYKLFWGVVEGCFSLIIVSPTSKTFFRGPEGVAQVGVYCILD